MFGKFYCSLLLAFFALFLLNACAPKPAQTPDGLETVAISLVADPHTNSQNPGQLIQAMVKPVKNSKPYSSDKEVIARGVALFQNNCTTCHSFQQIGIGPNLAGITADVSYAWLTRFIRNAPEVIKSDDARAKRLLAEYKQYMPAFPQLSDDDIHALVSFIHSNQNSSSGVASAAHLGESIKDPVPAKIPNSGIKLILEEVLTAPATAERIPLARINTMRVLTGGEVDRHFIQELRGLIYETKDKKLSVFMDITKERPRFISQPGLASGFGSFAFHPEFYKNGFFYTTHTEKAQSAPADFAYADSLQVSLQWVLTEWKIKNPAAATFSGTGREMWRVNMMTPIHGVQEISFNPLSRPGTPDYGLLYIGIGDGGAAEQGVYFICNSNKTIWSSVLRIDPKGRNSKNGKYGIPDSNPFANDKDPGALGEVFIRGFRNPNRITWAPDGKMLVSDIGLLNIEEVNIGKAGADYGWPAREGTFLLNYKGKMDSVYALPADDEKYNFTYPAAQFDHDEGNAISGGFVYNGNDVPMLKGKYIFGDIVSGRVFFVESSELKLGQQESIHEMGIRIGNKETTFRKYSRSRKTDLRFGLGPRDELYIFTKADGRIYKVIGSIVSRVN